MRSHGSYLLYSLGLRVWCFVVRPHAIKHVRVINSRGWGIERVRRDQETRGNRIPSERPHLRLDKEGGRPSPPSLSNERTVDFRLLRKQRSCGRSSYKRPRFEPEAFRQALSPRTSTPLHNFRGYRLPRSLAYPRN